MIFNYVTHYETMLNQTKSIDDIELIINELYSTGAYDNVGTHPNRRLSLSSLRWIANRTRSKWRKHKLLIEARNRAIGELRSVYVLGELILAAKDDGGSVEVGNNKIKLRLSITKLPMGDGETVFIDIFNPAKNKPLYSTLSDSGCVLDLMADDTICKILKRCAVFHF